MRKKSNAKWIQEAIHNKGSLRKTLKIKKGQRIPEEKLNKAAKGKGITAKRARLAKTLRRFRKKKKK